jgi:hypothetical protein
MTNEFSTAAAQSLHPKSRPTDDFQDDVRQAIEHFQKLNANQKARYFDFLQKVFTDPAWAKSGTGVKGKNIPFNSKDEEVDWPTVAEALVENEMRERIETQLEELGVSKDALEKVSELFFEAVEQRLNHEDDAFRQAVADLLNDYLPSPFISNEELDVVTALAKRVEDLQADIDFVEQENATLVEEIKQNLTEENNFIPNERFRKRSTVNDLMCESDENNSDASFNESNQHGNKQMNEYLRYFGSGNK